MPLVSQPAVDTTDEGFMGGLEEPFVIGVSTLSHSESTTTDSAAKPVAKRPFLAFYPLVN